MRSNQFVEQAIESLERAQPDLCQDKETRADCVEDFKDRLTITQLEEGGIKTRVVEVVFAGDTKEQTFEFLLALQKLYRTYNVQQQQERIDDRLAIFDYELATGEEAVSQFSQISQQTFQENSSALPREASLAKDSSQPQDFYWETSYGKKLDSEDLDREAIYRKAAQTEFEKVAVIQLIHLRQEMANNLIQSGFTWELIEYPTTGRKVAPQPWPSLSMARVFQD